MLQDNGRVIGVILKHNLRVIALKAESLSREQGDAWHPGSGWVAVGLEILRGRCSNWIYLNTRARAVAMESSSGSGRRRLWSAMELLSPRPLWCRCPFSREAAGTLREFAGSTRPGSPVIGHAVARTSRAARCC